MTAETPQWQRTIATISAILLGLIFLVSGGWKVLSPFKTGELLEQAQVPAGLGVLGAAVLGTLELLAAYLLFIPRFRRWGGLLGSALLIFFIGWIAYYYPVLVGRECSCFPLIKRTIGPGFFIGDGVMLLLAFTAFRWSPRVASFRVPAVAFVALVVFSGVSFGVNAAERRNAQPLPARRSLPRYAHSPVQSSPPGTDPASPPAYAPATSGSPAHSASMASIAPNPPPGNPPRTAISPSRPRANRNCSRQPIDPPPPFPRSNSSPPAPATQPAVPVARSYLY